MSVTIWRGRFTDAPMRNTGNVPCRLSRNYLKDQREGPVIFVSPRTGETAARRPTTGGHVGRYENRARVQLTHRAPGAIPHEDFTVNKSPL